MPQRNLSFVYCYYKSHSALNSRKIMEIKDILLKNEFHFKKQLGQNFITEVSLLRAVVRDSEVTSDDVVVEIGTGAGTLTAAISDSAKEVFTFDVDTSLKPILEETLAGRENITCIFKDILKMSDAEFVEIVGDREFKVVANIPYYITTPLIMRFIESDLKVKSITVMVQEEVADRLVARPNTEDYGAITLAVALRGVAKKTRTVDKRMFHPIPKVDSAVVHIAIDDSRYTYKDKKTLVNLMHAGFRMRRKTLVNNIQASFPAISKEVAKNILVDCGFSETIRGEVLGVSEYILIADKIYDLLS